MSILGSQTIIEPGSSFYAPIGGGGGGGGYVGSGGSDTNYSPTPGTIADGATATIFTLNTDGFLPEVGKSYLVSISVGLSGLSGAGTGAGAYIALGLRYNGVTAYTSAPANESGLPYWNLTSLFTRVTSPSQGLQIVLVNASGASIIPTSLIGRITSYSSVEVSNAVGFSPT